MENNQQQIENKDIVFGDIVAATDIFGEPIIEESTTDTDIVDESKDVKKIEEKKVEQKAEEKPLFEEVENKVEKKKDNTDYEGIYKALVASGEWEEVEIEGEDKTIDAETFKLIQKQQKENRLNAEKEKLLSVLSQDEKDFLEYKKNGGNALEFLKAQDFKQKAENLDISTDNGKKLAIYSYYRNFVGWSDEKTQKHINRIEKELELADEAQMAKDKIEEFTKAEFERIKAEAKQAKELRDKAENDFKESVKNNLKNKDYDTKKINSVIRDFTDRDERGYTAIDKKYLELRNNPEKVDELWQFLMNYEDFTKKISQKKVNEAQLDVFKTIKINKKSKENRQQKEEPTETELIL